MVDTEIDFSLEALAKELRVRYINGHDVFGLEPLRCEILLAIGAQLAAQLGIGKHTGSASGPSKTAAQRGGTGGRVPVRVLVCDDEDILMGQQALCAVFIVHRPHPRPV